MKEENKDRSELLAFLEFMSRKGLNTTAQRRIIADAFFASLDRPLFPIGAIFLLIGCCLWGAGVRTAFDCAELFLKIHR